MRVLAFRVKLPEQFACSMLKHTDESFRVDAQVVKIVQVGRKKNHHRKRIYLPLTITQP